MSLGLVLALAAIGLVAFATEAAIGFGSTVLAVSLGAQVMPLDRLLPAFVPTSLLISLVLIARSHRHIAWRLLVVELAPPVALGAALGLALFHVPARQLLQLAFAILVVALAALELGRLGARGAGPERPLPGRVGFAVYLAGGVTHGLFGTGGPLIVYNLRRRLGDKTAFRATLAVLWLVLSCALVVNYAALDLLSRESAGLSAVFAATLVPAFFVGDLLHRGLEPRRFQKAVCVVLLCAGVSLAVRTIATF